VSLVLANAAPLTYSVYESASGVASHAKVTVRSASDERVRARISANGFIELDLVQR
jgi:hypothetical protein